MPLPEHKRSKSVHVATMNMSSLPPPSGGSCAVNTSHGTDRSCFHAEATLEKATLEWKRLAGGDGGGGVFGGGGCGGVVGGGDGG